MSLPPRPGNPIVATRMTATPTTTTPWGPALAWLATALLLALLGWALPVNLKSVTPALLAAAGRDTPTVAAFGTDLRASEKLGPAALVLATAESLADPGAPDLAAALARDAARQPELIPWGGWDPFLDPLFNRAENRGRTASTPVLTFFITGAARTTLADYLAGSRSAGVRALLDLRAIDRTSQFVPATRAGGQALDAVILLAALLHQGEHFPASLQRELRARAEAATTAADLTALEPFFIDLLALGKRLDWTQLTALTALTDTTRTLTEFAQLARLAPDDLPYIYTAALWADSAGEVAAYLNTYGTPGLADLRLALAEGRGAVRQLLARQLPVNRDAGPAWSAAAALSLRHPQLMLALKYLAFLGGAFALFRGLDRLFAARTVGGTLPHLSSGALALLVAALLIIATEPFLLRAAPASDFKVTFSVPVLANVADPSSLQSTPATFAMDSSTLLSIGFFASLQVAMYIICLLKIGEIGRLAVPPLVRLKLMENEENLFDGGLYVGIGGTATALVLQVLDLIDPNLLAAYSSNLFGITCVALVKIRHVRPFKQKLILEAQDAIARAPIATT